MSQRGLALVLVALGVFVVGSCLQSVVPPAPVVSIEPASPTATDDLALVLPGLPASERTVSWHIEWERDGAVIAGLDGARLVPAEQTAAGESWRVSVALVDGDLVGKPGFASVDVAVLGDDDDSGDDDDDTTDPGDDDDATGDDDDVTGDDDDDSAGDDDDDSAGDDDDSGDDDDTGPPDVDGDGWNADLDCDDTMAEVFPGAPELCDGLDNNCDTVVPPDELDGDSDGVSTCGGDCDDTTGAIGPGQAEICDGADTDCDGQVPLTETQDLDGDGTLDCDDSDADGDGVDQALDCDDFDADVFPGQVLWFPDPRSDGTYDYNCDGGEEKEYPSLSSYPSYVICGQWQGWTAGWACGGVITVNLNPYCPGIPPCGGVAQRVLDQSAIYGCPIGGTWGQAAQACR